MSIASNTKDLPKLPQVLELDNFEDISLSQDKGSYSNAKKHEQNLKENLNKQRGKSSTKLPQFLSVGTRMSRSSSIGSVESSKSTKSTSSSSHYIVQMEKTPSCLTPSQRLKLRKSQLNESITKLRESSSINPVSIPYNDDSEDDEIDDTSLAYDLPLTMPITPTTLKERQYISDGSRLSCLSNSTTTSSILSHTSLNDTCSLTSIDVDSSYVSNSLNHTYMYENGANISTGSLNSLTLTKDAFDLSVLFQQSDSLKLYEEKRQKLKLLSDFKKIKSASVPSAQSKIFSHKSASTPNINSPLQQKTIYSKPMSFSNTSLPLHKSRKDSNTLKYYSYTRPVWLPPKSSYDKSKHQRESDDIIHNALLKEVNVNNLKVQKLEKIKKFRKLDIAKWENILTQCSKNKDKDIRKSSKIEDMYWRGISEEIRPKVWWKVIGNSLGLDEEFCDNYFNNSRKLIQHHKKHRSGNDRSTEDSEFYKLFSRIENDLNNIIQFSKVTRRQEDLERLKNIVVSFVIYLNHNYRNNKQEMDQNIKAYYHKGICNIAGILYYNYKNSYKTFVSLCNIYDTNILKISLNLLVASVDKNENSMLQARKSFQEKIVQPIHDQLNHKMNRLYVHFNVIKLDSVTYMHEMVLSIFSNLFDFELSSQIFDIFIFEENLALLKCIAGLLMKISHRLFGNKEEVLQILSNRSRGSEVGTLSSHYLNMGYSHEFIDYIRRIKI